MSMQWGVRGKTTAEINVTPLIDVLLVLLIIFMVILPQHRRGESADIPLPSTDHTPIDPDPIVLQLVDSGDGKLPLLKINQGPVGWDSLEEKFRGIYQHRSERTAFLKADPEIDFQYVAEALDIAHRSGVDRIGLTDVDSAKAAAVNGVELRR